MENGSGTGTDPLLTAGGVGGVGGISRQYARCHSTPARFADISLVLVPVLGVQSQAALSRAALV